MEKNKEKKNPTEADKEQNQLRTTERKKERRRRRRRLTKRKHRDKTGTKKPFVITPRFQNKKVVAVSAQPLMLRLLLYPLHQPALRAKWQPQSALFVTFVSQFFLATVTCYLILHVRSSVKVSGWLIVVVDRFYKAPFSALEQAHCAFAACDSK